VVLSDLGASRHEPTGVPGMALAVRVLLDRERLVALRPASTVGDGKFIFPPKLFTVGCGELVLRALLAAG